MNDISYIWTRFNKNWAKTGVLAGLGAGLGSILLAGLFSGSLAYPFRLVGAALLGPEALRHGSVAGFLTGALIHFGLSAFFGFVFAQFVWEESRRRILGLLGTLGGLAVWLFWSMMFMPAFNEPMLFLMSKKMALLLHLVFGATFGVLVIGLRSRFTASPERA